MNNNKIITFNIKHKHYGLYACNVLRVIQAVEFTAIPKQPPSLLGIVNMHGTVIPLLNINKLLGFGQHKIEADDTFIEIKINSHNAFFCCDKDIAIAEYRKTDVVSPKEIMTKDINHISSIVKINNKLILILDIEKLLVNEDISELNKIANNMRS